MTPGGQHAGELAGTGTARRPDVASPGPDDARITLDVYGLAIEAGGWPEPIADLGRDFAWFQTDAQPAAPAHVRIAIERHAPDYDALPPVRSSFVTPRNVVFQDEQTTIVDYFGRAVSILDRATQTLTIQGTDAHLVHEAAYHYALSRCGAHLDARGTPRLHALALSGRRGAVALMLPSGGGKSTMALRALREPGVRLLSEDTPLVDAEGVCHPFPLRIGINATDADSVPAEHVRRLERMEFHPKLAVDLAAFPGRIEDRPRPMSDIVIGRRTLGPGGVLRRLPRRAAAGTLLREAVIGVGVYQGMEFVLQRGMRDSVRQAGVLGVRARCCAAALRRSRVWELELGRDRDANWAAIAPLLD